MGGVVGAAGGEVRRAVNCAGTGSSQELSVGVQAISALVEGQIQPLRSWGQPPAERRMFTGGSRRRRSSHPVRQQSGAQAPRPGTDEQEAPMTPAHHSPSAAGAAGVDR
ncbi:hypothetical protein ACQ5JZ_29000, partial [Streptomyces sp. ZG43]